MRRWPWPRCIVSWPCLKFGSGKNADPPNQELRGFMAEEVGLIPAFGLHPGGAALRPVFAAARRSNCVLIPPSDFRIRFADLWRRRWDSNPRNLAALRFSRPAQSTTLPPLLYNNKQFNISDYTQETCLLPITCQLNECSAIRNAGGSKRNYTDRESVFASFSSWPTAKIRFRTALKRSANPPVSREADPD